MASIILQIKRFGDTPFGMFSKATLFKDGVKIASLGPMFSVELNWKGNKQDISCILEDTYIAKVGTFKGRYRNLELQDVPGRSNIEVHVANRASELKGCIAIGDRLGFLSGEWAVYNSTATLAAIMANITDTDYVRVVICSTSNSTNNLEEGDWNE